NICTAQALLAIMAGFYTVYHGPKGLKKIANRIHGITSVLAKALTELGYKLNNQTFFDTLTVVVGDLIEPINAEALNQEVNLRYDESSTVGISIDETTNIEDIKSLIKIFAKVKGKGNNDIDIVGLSSDLTSSIPESL